jgi:hypothetical protein
MNFITQFAHAGHHHTDEAATSGDSTLIVFGAVAAIVAIVAVNLVLLNGRKKTVAEPVDDSNE